jgi:hypothetical protein
MPEEFLYLWLLRGEMMKKLLMLVILFLVIAGTCGIASAIHLLNDTPPVTIGPGETVGTAEYRETVKPVPAVPAMLTVRRIHPARVKAGETVTITIRTVSEQDQNLQVKLYEDQRPGVEYPDSPAVNYLNYQALKIPYYTWSFDLAGRSSKEVTYSVRPRAVGTIVFTPAVAQDQYGNSFRSDSGYIIVECTPDGRCDRGENFIYCPDDCPTGSPDGTCDGIADGRSDPDCTTGADPDAGTGGPEVPDTPSPGTGINPAIWGLLALVFLAGCAGVIIMVRKRGEGK